MKITIEHNGKSIGVNTTDETPKEVMHSMIDQAIEYMDEAHMRSESFKENFAANAAKAYAKVMTPADYQAWLKQQEAT